MAGKLSKLSSSGRAVWTTLKRSFRDQAHLATIPTDPRIDDTYVVEFPKSGVTWLTFLIATVNLKMSGINRVPTFYAINDSVPDIHTSRNVPPPLPFPGHRFIKSHAPYNPLYSKVIYLVRDPRDVMASYHAFTTKLGWYQNDLSAMIRDPKWGIQAWCDHAEGWLTQTKPSVSFTVIRYEDLRTDTLGCLQRLYKLHGFDLDESLLQDAIKACEFGKMKENESFCSEKNLTLPQDFTFVRKGGSSHKDEMSPSDTDYILGHAKKYMDIFGYDV